MLFQHALPGHLSAKLHGSFREAAYFKVSAACLKQWNYHSALRGNQRNPFYIKCKSQRINVECAFDSYFIVACCTPKKRVIFAMRTGHFFARNESQAV